VRDQLIVNTRLVLRHWLVLLVAILSLAGVASLAADLAVESVGMTVSDADRAMEFYSQFNFRKASEVEVFGAEYEHLEGVFGARMRIVRMQLGSEFIDLTQYLAPPGRPIPPDSQSNDRWFQHIAIVVRDMDAAFARVRAMKVHFVSTGPQTLPATIPAAAGIKAFYFRDPDGHNLELIYFPPGKGDPRWQQPDDNLFLGIDHTAIGIASTAASLQFYRDLLGMHKAGESENFGTEQEHLNQVFGAHLQITGMRAKSGPGIEFLEYLTPRDGRSIPEGTKANDVVHWQTMIATDDLDTLVKKLRQGHVGFVSSDVTVVAKDKVGFSRGVLVKDPDGHDVLLVEK
jgi:catechol 2,3-dioxygenase-like lactoylglutathione lyase family enzyme